MVCTEEGTNNGVYRSVVIGADGILYTVAAGGARSAVCEVGTEEWIHVKVILDLGKNLKSVYVNGEIVMENATISNVVDTSLYAVESVSLMQFSINKNNTIGTVHVDDYRFYPYE
jgi:CxxC motif-containing protein